MRLAAALKWKGLQRAPACRTSCTTCCADAAPLICAVSCRLLNAGLWLPLLPLPPLEALPPPLGSRHGADVLPPPSRRSCVPALQWAGAQVATCRGLWEAGRNQLDRAELAADVGNHSWSTGGQGEVRTWLSGRPAPLPAWASCVLPAGGSAPAARRASLPQRRPSRASCIMPAEQQSRTRLRGVACHERRAAGGAGGGSGVVAASRKPTACMLTCGRLQAAGAGRGPAEGRVGCAVCSVRRWKAWEPAVAC